MIFPGKCASCDREHGTAQVIQVPRKRGMYLRWTRTHIYVESLQRWLDISSQFDKFRLQSYSLRQRACDSFAIGLNIRSCTERDTHRWYAASHATLNYEHLSGNKKGLLAVNPTFLRVTGARSELHSEGIAGQWTFSKSRIIRVAPNWRFRHFRLSI